MSQLGYGGVDVATVNDATSLKGNVMVGDSTADLVGHYGVTAISQRAGAAQATSLVGTASSADVNTDLKAAVLEIMNTLTAAGLWKGAA
jgi:hypothetical protein